MLTDEDDEERFRVELFELCESSSTLEKLKCSISNLEESQIVDMVDNAGNSAAHHAALSGNVLGCKWILEKFPSLLNLDNYDDRSILDLAAEKGCIGLVLSIQDSQMSQVERDYLVKDYFGCSECGFCKVGRKRFGGIHCERNKPHTWNGNNRPRHVSHVKAINFNEATSKLNNNGRQKRAWWCNKNND